MPDEELIVETPEEETTEVELKEAGLEGLSEDVIDPGQNEGKRKVEHEPGPETPRFKKVYARLKGAEETIEGLKAKESAREAAAEELRKHNAALMEKIENLSARAIEAVETVKQPESDPPEIIAIRRSIEELEASKEEAVENLKGKEVVRIDKELRKLERVMEGYEFHKRQQAEGKKKEKEKAFPKQEQFDPDKDPDIIAFKKDAPWYQKDPLMTGAAKEYDLFLSQQPEWRNVSLPERLKKVREDIEARFDGAKNSKPKPVGAESGLGLQRPSGIGSKTVKLSAQQLEVAKGLGIKPEDYAKQLDFLGGAV